MVQSVPFVAAAASLLLLPAALADGLYPKSSPVLNIDEKSYHSLIARSNYSSIVEFYAPWCGHCQNLKPAYEKAAKSLSGLANVAAVNCDDEDNKPFCQSMGVQGFPTLRVLRPGKKAGKPSVDEYRGQRTAKAIVDTVIETIPNHVKRLKDSDYADWVANGDQPKAILFSDKGTVSGLIRAVAIDFLDALDVGQVRNNQKDAVETFGVQRFPTLVLIPGNGKEPIVYDGEMKKDGIVSFLSQAASPNASRGKDGKAPKSSSSAKAKDASDFKKSSASQASKQAKTDKASQTLETLEDDPTESPNPKVDTPKPVEVSDPVPPITFLPDGLSLQQKCLNDKAGTCILLLLPEQTQVSANTLNALKSLSEIHHKYSSGGRKLFPFYQLPESNSQATALRKKLDLSPSGVEIVAVNGKRAWWRHYADADFGQDKIESWVDAIRMGDSPKLDLPKVLVANAADLPAEPVQVPTDPEIAKMMESMKGQTPDGLDFELEEISTEEYEKLMKQASKDGKPFVPEEHDEL